MGRHGARKALVPGRYDADDDDADVDGLDDLLEYAHGSRKAAAAVRTRLMRGVDDITVDADGYNDDDADGTCCESVGFFCRGVCCEARARSRRCAALQIIIAAACIVGPGYALVRLLVPSAAGGSGPGPAPSCRSPIYAGALDVVVDGVRAADWAVLASNPASLGRPDTGSLQVGYGWWGWRSVWA